MRTAMLEDGWRNEVSGRVQVYAIDASQRGGMDA